MKNKKVDLSDLRQAAGYTNITSAAAALGIARETLSKYESGYTTYVSGRIFPDTAIRLATLYKVSPCAVLEAHKNSLMKASGFAYRANEEGAYRVNEVIRALSQVNCEVTLAKFVALVKVAHGIPNPSAGLILKIWEEL